MTPGFVRGDMTGLDIPVSPEALLAAGPDWLTRAFRTWGSLDADNVVTGIVSAAPVLAGNSGEKLALVLAYARDEGAPPANLFVKFARHPDAFRDRRRAELDGEVRLAALSRHPAFPVTVPFPAFGDFHGESGSGLLASAAIRFGEGGIEPLRAKCRDHEIADPLPCYEVTVAALARLAAADRSGRLSPDIDALFPWNEAAARNDLPIAVTADELSGKVAAIRAFVSQCPRLFAPRVADPAFLERFARDAASFHAHEGAVRTFLLSDPRLVALAHWNTNIDNAWFWREAGGPLRCGLFDWGMARRMNAGNGLWGGLSAADPAMLEAHLDGLLDLYVRELAENGGPHVEPGTLAMHFDLATAMIGLSMMLDCPAIVLSRAPRAADAMHRHDPLVSADQVAHGFLHVFANWLDVWAQRDFGASLERALAGG